MKRQPSRIASTAGSRSVAIACLRTIPSAPAAETGLSPSSVRRYINLFDLQPHRSKSYKPSTDPFFIEKVRDIVSLYPLPPENAPVLCVDQKSRCQALERTQPMLPMGLGYVEGITHDYKQEFLAFLRHIDQNVPAELDVHLICDNYSSQKHPKVRAWLASRPRYHVHFTPTYASLLNQVEHWFRLITQQAIRRSSFKSIPDLVARITRYTERYNLTARPFVWTATAESILAKIERLCKGIGGTQH